MKILCPIDFSMSSINAVYWAAEYVQYMGGGNIHILNCINTTRRDPMFSDLGELLKERSNWDINLLKKELTTKHPKIQIASGIYLADPKVFISRYSTQRDFDLIIMGSRGLTTLKYLTMGSVAFCIINGTKIPIMLVPDGQSFARLDHIVIGADNDVSLMSEPLDSLHKFIKGANTKVSMTHVHNENDIIDKYHLAPKYMIEGYETKHHVIHSEKPVAVALADYSVDNQADLLVMIHRKKNWIQKLISQSHTINELYTLKVPFLILSE